jgi:uncharacterized protein YyaL (SSP411 family)
MTHPAGGFFSTQDADSEGEEGKFFLWTPDEVVAVLGEAEAELFNRYYDVSEQGNFEGKNILHVNEDLDALAQRPDARPDYIDSLRDVLTHARQRLFLAREQRPKPARDEKILAAWNGLMMRAFAEAGAALDRPDYIAAARRNAQFILDEMTAEDGRLFRSWKSPKIRIKLSTTRPRGIWWRCSPMALRFWGWEIRGRWLPNR